MVGVVDGENAVHGSRAVEVPLCVLVYQTYLSSLRSSSVVAAAGGERGGRRDSQKLVPGVPFITPERRLSTLLEIDPWWTQTTHASVWCG